MFHNTPVNFVPIDTPDRVGIVKIEANNANNPGNSVFGPKGFVCPGNTVTTLLMKSVGDLKRQFRVDIEGKLEFKPSTVLKEITNKDAVHVVFHKRDESEREAIQF